MEKTFRKNIWKQLMTGTKIRAERREERKVKRKRRLKGGEGFVELLMVLLLWNCRIAQSKLPLEDGENLLKIALARKGKSGILTKQGGKRKSWKKRFVVVNADCLLYFRSSNVSVITKRNETK